MNKLEYTAVTFGNRSIIERLGLDEFKELIQVEPRLSESTQEAIQD